MECFNSGYSSLKELYEADLYEINDLKFTFREIDIIACVIHNRGDKKIASILSISPRTVNAHVYNIMGKLSCHSKDQIIDFIEKAGMHIPMRSYYLHLLVRNIFEQQLIQIARKINTKPICIKYDKRQALEIDKAFFESIKKDCKLANIELEELIDGEESEILIDFADITKEQYYHDVLASLKKAIDHRNKELESIIEAFNSQYLAIKNNYNGNTNKHLPYIIRKLLRQKNWTWGGARVLLFSIGILVLLTLIVSKTLFDNHVTTTDKENYITEKIVNLLHSANKSSSTSSIVPNFKLEQKRDPYYVERILESGANIFEEFDNILAKYDSVLVTAPGGSGKSSCVIEYAYRKKEQGQEVVFFDSASIDKINRRYIELAVDMDININDVSQELIIRKVNNKLSGYSKGILFIFDNSKNYSDIEHYVTKLPKGAKYIITSRDGNLIPNVLEKQHIMLGSHFTQAASKEYLMHVLSDRFSNKDKLAAKRLENLLSIISKSPINLSLAAGYLHKNKLTTIEEYIELYQSEGELSLLYGDIATSKHSKSLSRLMQYSSYLDPDFISIRILSNLLSVDKQTLQSYVEELESMSLIKFVKKDNNEMGIKVHRLIQQDIITFTNRHKQLVTEGILLDKQTIYAELFKGINELMSAVKEVPDRDWEIASLIYPSLKKLIKHFRGENTELILASDQDIFKNYTSLMYKLGSYNDYVLKEYNRSIEYYDFAKHKSNMDKISLNKGWVYFKQRKLKQALISFEESIKLSHKKSATHADALSGKGCVYDQMKDNAAIKYHEEAYKIYRELYDNKDHAEIARLLHNIGWYYKNTGDKANLPKALKKLEESYEMRKRLYPEGAHPTIASSLNSIGDVYRRQGGRNNLEKALEYQKQALAIREKVYNHQAVPDIISSYSRLGDTYRDIGNYGKSIEYYEKLLSGTYELYGSYNHIHILGAFQRIGEIYELLGNNIEAIEYYKKCYVIIIGNGYDIKHSDNKKIIEYLTSHTTEFVNNPEQRIFIIKRALFTEEIYKIKEKIQKPILNKLYECGKVGRWENSWFGKDGIITYGAAYYLSDNEISKAIGKNMTNRELQIARSLGFEAINLGIMSSKIENRNYSCLFAFINTYSELTKKILENHAEYFVDGSLLKKCRKKDILTEDQLEEVINHQEM